MTTLTLEISEDRFAKLKEVAKGLLITPEELVTASIEDLLARPEADFEQAITHVLKKNSELYRRLA